MPDYTQCGFWLETARDDLTPRPTLDGSCDADVAILGAGFTGLWTAYYLLKAQPSLRVVLLEREIAGFGASGRNGGWCSSKLNIGIDAVARRHGEAAAKAVQRAMYDTVDEVGRVCAAEGIDCGYTKGGALFLARGPEQVASLEELAGIYERFGFGDRHRVLDAAATAERIRVRGTVASMAFSSYATLHPGRLVRGLARVVERLGARLHERTEVTGFTPGRHPVLHTPRGDVRAGLIVLAGEAYLTRLPPLHRALLPIYSLIVLTEPLPDSLWSEIGWRARECVASFRLTIDYLSRTEDGRILFGGRGAPYRFGSAIADAYDRDEPTHEMLRRTAREWFPGLAGVRFTHAWGGPLGMPRDWMPTIGCDRATGVATARGYTGHGVSASNLAGRTLADLIIGRTSDLTALPMVGHRSAPWEPEPLRWLAVRYIQQAFGRIDARAARTGRPPTGRSIAEWLSRP
ncbi:MAG TPA: FAD-dependent oxidoreductase [Candidatus Polarisedimenticolia bacterium]|nr:FAD-dependent oxidoreductase [Candidatus Polarisedimenticolia bacterium]